MILLRFPEITAIVSGVVVDVKGVFMRLIVQLQTQTRGCV
jgi:hypothetical protein